MTDPAEDELTEAQRIELARQREREERERRLLERERNAEITQQAAERMRADAAEAARLQALEDERARETELNDELAERERRVLAREKAAEEAMRAAQELHDENLARTPSVKVSMDIPMLDDCPSFEQYQRLVTMWAKTTDIPKHKLGSVLSMTIPVNSTKYGDDLREDLFDNVDTEQLTNNNNGVQMILDYLKIRIGRNEREAQIETFVSFLKYQRRTGQSIQEYILEFERHYKKCKVLNILFNDNVSAFLLLYNANLNEVEYKLIKGVMNIKEDEGRLYIKTKAKLSEMLSNSIGEVVNSSGNIGNEILLTQHMNPQTINKAVQDVLVAQGWKPPHKRNSNQRWKQHHKQQRPTNNYKTNYATKNSNPVVNGEILQCYECKSTEHLLLDCPKNKNPRKGRKTIKKEVYYTVVNDTDTESEGANDQLSSSDDSYVSKQQQNPKYTNKIVMFTDDQNELSRFTVECFNHGALDTCCTSSVCGEEWLKVYLDAITPTMHKLVKGPTPSNKQFTFGNQGTLNSSATYQIPIKVGGNLKMIEIDSIKSDIPLLISMNAMKELGMVLDLKNDQITINNKVIPVIRTNAGHYSINLLDDDQIPVEQIFMINNSDDHEQVNLVDLNTADEQTQIKLLDKIHKQFGHRPKLAFVQVLKSADQWQDKFSPMIDNIIKRCEGCIMRKRSPDKPAVAPPLANDFNQVVTMDLKIWDANKNQYILYMIDAFTRYTVATVINRKTPDQVINALFEKWIQYFGIMNKVMTDNGGEFTNAEMIEVANRVNLIHFTTGAESPWQNGLCEKNHAHTDNILQAVLKDHPQLSLKAALTWACTAKNSLTNIHGYSPFQLVFGRNIRLPNVLNDPPPTYEIKTKSKALAQNITAIHATRLAYMKAETCERLKKALKSKIRTFHHTYEHGDYVYYKRDRQDTWEGPARVVFQDNKVILVRHGGFFYKVSANRLLPAQTDTVEKIQNDQTQNIPPKVVNTTKPITRSATPNIIITDADNIDKVTQESNKNPAETQETNHNQEQHAEDSHDIIMQDNIENQEQNTTNHQTTDNHQAHVQDQLNEVNNSDQEHTTDDDNIEDPESTSTRQVTKPLYTRTRQKASAPTTYVPIKLKHKDRIEIKHNNKWHRGIVTTRAGKAKGKFPNWYNFKLDNGQTFSADIKYRQVRKLSNQEAMATWIGHHVFAVMVPKADRNSEACIIAKEQELSKLKEFNTYKVVEDQGQDRIATTWVLTEKADSVRARLTCKGFQEEEDFPTDSPTIQKSSIRLLLTLATTKNWRIQTIDIKSAFLQGDKLTREVYVKPPKEAQLKNKLWKLYKCLYGLKDASRQWYLRLKRTLKKHGFQKCKYDGGLFYQIKEGVLQGAVGIHVDDFLSIGNNEFMTKTIPEVLKTFIIGKAEEHAFMYTGFRLDQDSEGITLNQNEYVQNLEILDLNEDRLKNVKEEMDQSELTFLRMYAGALNWAVGISRPDLSFDMISLSTQFKGGKVLALKQAHSVMKLLKKAPAYLRLSNLQDIKDCELWVFSDAAHRNLNNNTDSAGGYIIFLINIKTGKCAPIEWRSNKIKRRVSSTLAAEMLALTNALDAAVGTRDQIFDISAGKINLKIKALTDNKSARDTIYSEKANDQKRLRAEIAAVKELLERREIEEVRWVPGQYMLADVLTKKGVKRQNLMSVLQEGQIDLQLINVCSS